MTRLQWIVVVIFLLLFAILYFGFDVRTNKQRQATESRTVESTDATILIREAKQDLSVEQLSSVRILEQSLQLLEEDSLKTNTFKELSSLWYKLQHPSIAGYYAEKVALVEDTEAAWSIAGTTFAICVQRMGENKVRQYCTSRAFKAFENAISINPSNIQNQVNLALTHLETQNPMMGIQMLRELNQKHPENVLVLMTLGKQAVRTNQLELASERFLRILEIESNNKEAACALVDIYNRLNQTDKIEKFMQTCQS